MRNGRFSISFFLAAALAFLAFSSAARGDSDLLPLFLDRLPGSSLPCALSGGDRRPRDISGDQPLVLYITDREHLLDTPLGSVLAEFQADYWPWFTWAGLLSGQAEVDVVTEARARSPLQFEFCFNDRDGTWIKKMNIARLPAVVIVNADGYISERFHDASESEQERLHTVLEDSALAGRLVGRRARDFRLPSLNENLPLSLLDVAGEEFTALLFLQTNFPAGLSVLGSLENLRDNEWKNLNVVTVFTGGGSGSEIQGYLDRIRATPDSILLDSHNFFSSQYHIRSIPTLVIIGPEGRVIFTRRGYRQSEGESLSAVLSNLFVGALGNSPETPFTGAGRIHREAVEYLADGNPSMAALYWERILEIYPAAQTIHCSLGDAYGDLGRSRDAAREYARCISSQIVPDEISDISLKIRSLLTNPH